MESNLKDIFTSDKLTNEYCNHIKKRVRFEIEGCGVICSDTYVFVWNDEDEKYIGKRYMWTTNQLDLEYLFKKIILSDIAEDTELDCAVYIRDNQSENVFFLYDDKGIDVYSDNEDYILSLKNLE